MRFFLILIILLGITQRVLIAQCCSVGNPVMGLGTVGVLEPNSLRSITFLKTSYSDTYFEGSQPSTLQGKTASYNYIGQLLGYGISKRLGVELELGYFLNKTEEDEWLGRQNTYGFSSGVMMLKGLIWKSSDVWEFSTAAGLRFPLKNRVFTDEFGLPYPVALQPSIQAYGAVGQLFLYRNFTDLKLKSVWLNRFEFNASDPDAYKVGSAWFSSLFLSRSFKGRHVAIIQLRNEWRAHDFQGETRFSASGGDVLLVSPQYAYILPAEWKLFLMAELPLYRRYNGMQMGAKMAFGISLMKDFKLAKP
jgi:hypothetical protein